MSSYKGHSIFALILSLFMFANPFAISLALIGANIPDFDHEFKRNHVLSIFSLGIAITLFLYLLDLPFYLGLVLILLAVIFLISSHRGFTHSILGCIVLTACIFLLVYFGMDLSYYFDLSTFSNLPLNYLILTILLILLAVLFLNRKISIPFAILMSLYVVLVSMSYLPLFKANASVLVFSIFLGLSSHMILDSFTPSGIKPFSPFSDKKYYKSLGILLFFILIISYLVLFGQDSCLLIFL